MRLWAPRSLRLRLTLLFSAVTLISIAVLGGFLDYWLSSRLEARDREQLHTALRLFSHMLSEVSSPREIPADSHRFEDVVSGHGELQAAIFLPSGEAILSLSSFQWPAELIERAVRGEQAEESISYRRRQHRLLVAPVPVGQGEERVLVALAHDTEEDREIIHDIHKTIVLACLLAGLLAGTLGYAAASSGLQPLRRMVGAAARISAERLDQRLELKDAPLELLDLGESFNAMLARLEQSFRRLSDFSSDLAHELRTPLTNLMLQAQVALDRPRTDAELRAVLETSLEELQRLARTVNDMLFLAKADHAQLRLNLASFPVEEEVQKNFDYFELLASERSIRLLREGSVAARADREMVRRVLANLLSNAVRYADAGSTVLVRLRSEGDKAVVEVENRGAPLSREQLARVFDRFFRTDASRSAASEGAGLGLAIVKSIVELHGGGVHAASNATGNVFRVTFPEA